MSNPDEAEEMWGKKAKHAEYSIGDQITYKVEQELHTGTILWAYDPGKVGKYELPSHYAVERDGTVNHFPDMVYQRDILTSPQETQEPAMEQCPHCGQWHYVGQIEFCPLNRKRPC